MTKQEILKRLDNLNLDKNEYIIVSGASLVVQEIIDETFDIDLACSNKYYNKINWPTRIGAFGLEIKYSDSFEIGPNMFSPNDTIVIEGYRFLSIEKCFENKIALNRAKDKKVIEILKKALNK